MVFADIFGLWLNNTGAFEWSEAIGMVQGFKSKCRVKSTGRCSAKLCGVTSQGVVCSSAERSVHHRPPDVRTCPEGSRCTISGVIMDIMDIMGRSLVVH